MDRNNYPGGTHYKMPNEKQKSRDKGPKITGGPKGRNYPLNSVHAYDEDERAALLQMYISGNSVSRRTATEKSVSNNYFQGLRLKVAAGLVSAAVVLGAAFGPGVINSIKRNNLANKEISTLVNEYDNIVARQDPGYGNEDQAPIYNYREIAEHLVNSTNFDDNLYALYRVFTTRAGNHESYNKAQKENPLKTPAVQEVNNVLAFTDFGSFENYLEIRGYDNTLDYSTDMIKRIGIEQEMEQVRQEKNKEISEMREELNEIGKDHPYTTSDGGKTL